MNDKDEPNRARNRTGLMGRGEECRVWVRREADGEESEGRSEVRWGVGAKDVHPLHPTAAQGSASARLIQSNQVWTPSPINPGM